MDFLLALYPQLTGEQAVIELAFAVGFLTGEDRDWLLREMVDDTQCVPIREHPEWNHDRGELTFQGELIRRVRVGVATQIVKILDAFQLQGWPDRIGSPINDDMTHRDAIRALNSRLTAIRFCSDGTGRGVLWEIVPPSTV